jgi:hypothetical protein
MTLSCGLLRACADRLATFHICRFSELSNQLPIAIDTFATRLSAQPLNARHLKNVPGRKTDVKDAEWICRLVEHGLVHPSFVPPKEIREGNYPLTV